MSELNMDREVSRLEKTVASALSDILNDVSIDSTLKVEPSGIFLGSLEFYIPQLLSPYYPEWESESLDGFYLTTTRKTGSETAEFAGSCILISDQSLAPFLIRLTLSSSRDSIAAYQVFLGKGNSGQLGISEPRRKSRKAREWLYTFSEHPNDIRWEYAVSSEAK